MRQILVGSFALLSVCSQAMTIYDTLPPVGGTLAYSSLSPEWAIADGITTLDAGAGNHWQVNAVTLAFVTVSPNTYDFSARIRFYDTFTPGTSSSTSAFSNKVSDVNWQFHIVHSNFGATYDLLTLDYQSIGEQFNLASGQMAGFRADIRWGTNVTHEITLAMRDAPPTVGSTAINGFYQDFNADGIIEQDEDVNFIGWSDTNVVMQMDAQSVPEPVTLVVLGFGSLLALRGRRKS